MSKEEMPPQKTSSVQSRWPREHPTMVGPAKTTPIKKDKLNSLKIAI